MEEFFYFCPFHNSGCAAVDKVRVVAVETVPGAALEEDGAAAHLIHPGDLVILIGYGLMDDAEAHTYQPKVIFVDKQNHILEKGADPAGVPAGSGLLDPRG
mgnify:CR=1 FL=1